MATHRSPLAGSWYPRSASELQQLLAHSLEKSIGRTGAFVRRGGAGFIVPHAGPAYSGAVAATAYRHVQAAGGGRIVVLGFSHRRPIEGIAIPRVDAIETPLGAVTVDGAAVEALAGSPPFHVVPEPEACDHSVEIQLPFLQTFVPGATLVPLYVGRMGADERRAAADALRGLMDEGSVLVASSDLTHYGPDFGYVPFRPDGDTAARLRALDDGVLAAAGSLDPALFCAEVGRTRATVCGVEPIRLLLETLSGHSDEVFQETLDYDTSGAIGGDYEHSVSYGAVGYFPASSYYLDPSGQAELLASARYSLDHYRQHSQRRYRRESPDSPLQQRGRAFVTVYADGKLQGCLGRVEDPIALADCVPQLTLAAAYEDDRFEAPPPGVELEIEIHVLTPLKRIADPSRLVAGEHGGYLRAGARRGLLLPVVAARHQLSREVFLRMLAQKAGLPEKIYARGGFDLSVFRDQSFREGGHTEAGA